MAQNASILNAFKIDVLETRRNHCRAWFEVDAVSLVP